MSRIAVRLLLLVSLMLTFAACERRPLVEYAGKVKVRVVLDTKEIPNVTSGIYNEKVVAPLTVPGTFRVLFYDHVTNELESQAFISRKGVDENGEHFYEGYVFLNPGKYDMVCYNFDTPSTLVNKEQNKNTIEAFTSEISEHLYTRFKSRVDLPIPRIYYEPDHFFVARENGVEVLNSDDFFSISTKASTIIDTYYVQVRLVNGQYASNAVAMLTDLAPSSKFAIDEPKYNEYAGTYFEMYRSVDMRKRAPDQDVLCAVFNTFGKRPDHIEPTAESQLYLSFNVVTADGNSVEMTLNMDSIFQTTEAKEHKWLFIDKEIVLPEPESGGFEPSVEGWNDQVGEIELGK